MRPIQVMLPEAYIELLRELGEGSVSAGIRDLIEAEFEEIEQVVGYCQLTP